MSIRKEVIGYATLYLGDCRDILPQLQPVDAVVTDPPYGIGEAAGRNKSRSSLVESTDYGTKDWDDEPIDDATLFAIIAKGRHSIIFGGNYYPLPPSSCWLVWDKVNGKNDFADCELAWTNLPGAVRLLRFMWNGMMQGKSISEGHLQQGNKKLNENRYHPTQKPVPVMIWILGQLPKSYGTILDPLMGSGSTGVAAVRMGKSFIGIEKEADHFDDACRRIEEEVRNTSLLRLCSVSGQERQSLLPGVTA